MTPGHRWSDGMLMPWPEPETKRQIIDLYTERDRLREAAQWFIDVFDDDNAWIENGDNADYALEQLRTALQEDV